MKNFRRANYYFEGRLKLRRITYTIAYTVEFTHEIIVLSKKRRGIPIVCEIGLGAVHAGLVCIQACVQRTVLYTDLHCMNPRCMLQEVGGVYCKLYGLC